MAIKKNKYEHLLKFTVISISVFTWMSLRDIFYLSS